MSYEPIDDSGRIVQLRKAASCEWCGQQLAVGEQAVTRTYRIQGEFHSGRMHPECYSAMRDYFAGPDCDADGFFDGHAMARGKPYEAGLHPQGAS